MLARDPVQVRTNPAAAAAVALAIAAIGAATILGAWFFEYGLGLAPCPLCLQQRIPYYVAIPLAVLVVVAALRNAPRALLAIGLGVIALAMLAGSALGAYHAGIEWKWWEGPGTCAGGFALQWREGGIVDTPVIRCDEASWRFLGLSFAGWNAAISAILSGLAVYGAARRS